MSVRQYAEITRRLLIMKQTIKQHPKIVAGSIIALIGILLLNDQVIQFLWQYFVGPVVADAQNTAEATYMGISAQPGYNYYNTAAYAILAGLSIFGLERLLQHFEIGTDDTFVLALIPFILLGGLTRTMADAMIISYPFNIILITPLIYFVIFGLALLSIDGSLRLAERYEYSYHYYLAGIGSLFCLGAVSTLLNYIVQNGASEYTAHLLLIPIGVIGIGLAFQYGLAPFRPDSFLASTVGSVAVGAHGLDGASTAIGTTYLNYSEKHIVSEAVIDLAGTPFAFTALKLLFILTVLTVVEQETDDRRFTLLVLLGIIAVGMGPGLRNITRAILGV